MAEADVFDEALPEGWYDDPAKPGMQRWWTGSAWSDHVRYSDKVRLYAVPSQPAQPQTLAAPPTFAEQALTQPALSQPAISQPVAPAPYEAPRATGWVAADTVELPQLTLPARYLEPTAPAADTTFDDFYVPMRDFPAPRTAHVPVAAPRRSGRHGGVWLMVIAAIGIAAGVALWILIPR